MNKSFKYLIVGAIILLLSIFAFTINIKIGTIIGGIGVLTMFYSIYLLSKEN